MRLLLTVCVVIIAAVAPARAAVLSPAEIQTAFFNGQPFTASAGNIKYKMVFTPDGKMMREPIGKGGSKNEGTWKLSNDGFCTTWKTAVNSNCYRLMTAGDKKWSVMKGKAVVATWMK
jgi:hypothetical protein